MLPALTQAIHHGKLFAMKRILSCSLFAALLLSACQNEQEQIKQEKVIPKLHSNEVLQRSADATKTLESGTFNGDVQFSRGEGLNSIQGTANIDGSLNNTNKQVEFALDLSMTGTDAGTDFAASAQLDIIVAGIQEVYIKLNAISIEPDTTFLSQSAVNAMLGTWWLLPQSEGIEGEIASVTPDPTLLQAQAEVVSLVEDKGIQQLGDGHAYHYLVEVDKEKLVTFMQKAAKDSGEDFDAKAARESLETMQMTGELWIDAESFHTRKLTWNMVQDAEAEEPFTLTFTASLDNHNAADPIVPPQDAEAFSPMLFIQHSLPTLPTLPPSAEDPYENLDPETREILEQVLQGEYDQPPIE